MDHRRTDAFLSLVGRSKLGAAVRLGSVQFTTVAFHRLQAKTSWRRRCDADMARSTLFLPWLRLVPGWLSAC